MTRKGFTLIEMVMAIALLSILAVGLVTVISDSLDEARFDETLRRIQEIRNAMVGDPSARTGSRRTSFGYLGDVGALPTAVQGLEALRTNPGVPASGWSSDASSRIGIGWNGPYFPQSEAGVNHLEDAWGRPFIYNPSGTPPTVASYGADGIPGGSGFNRDITIQFPANVLSANVHGFVLNGGAQWSGTAQVELNQPNGSGAVLQRLQNISPTDKGHFSFADVPPGVRSVSIYVPSKAAATRTLGPLVFTSDRPYAVIPTRLVDLGTSFNLEVPIELLDTGIASNTTAITWERSRTSLDTADYDGTVTYRFEVVCRNQDTSNRTVSLIDAANAAKASIEIQGSTTQPKRFDAIWTPTPGASNYRIQTAGTTPASQLTCYTGRILVHQVGATRTKIYIPLVANTYNAADNNNTITGSSVDSTTTRNSYLQPTPNRYSIWRKDSSRYTTLHPTNPWTLEAIVSSTAGNPQISLFNKTTGNQVAASETTGGSGIALASSSFADNAANFSNFNDFEVRIKRQGGAPSGSLYLFKAGLWVKLISLSQAEVYFRYSRLFSASSASVIPHARALVDTAKFSSATAYHEAVGFESPVGASDIAVVSHGFNDVDVPAPGGIAGSSINFNSATKLRSRSGPFTLTPAERFLPSANVTTGTLSTVNAFIVIHAQ